MSAPAWLCARTKLVFSLLAVAVWLAGGCGPMFADTFDFSYTFPIGTGGGGDGVPVVPVLDAPPTTTVSASGTMTGALVAGQDYYLITGITGTWNWDGTAVAITGLIAPGGFGSNDNLLYFNSAPLLDGNGISFTVAPPGAGDDGLGDVNVYYDTGGEAYTEFADEVGDGPFNVTSSTVPEPSAIILLGIGLAGIGIRKFRR